MCETTSHTERIDMSRVLPPYMIYKSAADRLYTIGLTVDIYSSDGNIQRKWFNKPILFFITFIVFMINRCICLLIDIDNEMVFLLLGDLGYLIGVKPINDVFFILISLLAINTQ